MYEHLNYVFANVQIRTTYGSSITKANRYLSPNIHIRYMKSGTGCTCDVHRLA